MIKLFLKACIMVFLIGIAILANWSDTAEAVGVTIKASPDMTYAEKTMNYTERHPGWGVFSATNAYGNPFLLNCKLEENGSLTIHDALYHLDYTVDDWNETKNYHFWPINGTEYQFYTTSANTTVNNHEDFLAHPELFLSEVV